MSEGGRKGGRDGGTEEGKEGRKAGEQPTLSSDIQTGSSCCFLISSLTVLYQLSIGPVLIMAGGSRKG